MPEKTTLCHQSHADRYIEACDHSFDTYSKSIQPLQEFLKEREPIERFTFFDSDVAERGVLWQLDSRQRH